MDLSWSGDVRAIDVNDDGYLDLYVLDMQGEDHLWLNEEGRHFRDASATYFPRTPWGSMGAKVFDFDGDGRLDLFVTDMHSDMFVDIVPGNWAEESRKAGPYSMPDDFFPAGRTQFVFGNALFVNHADTARGASSTTTYQDVSDRVGVETYWPWGPSVDDINADGWDDVFITAGMNFPFRYAPNSVLLNESGRHFVASEFALGVEPRPPGRRILKVMDGETGYLSQRDLPLYFGLGDADHAASLEVRWPSGQRQRVAGPIRSGRTLEVVEP